jgi:hypothetical protein
MTALDAGTALMAQVKHAEVQICWPGLQAAWWDVTTTTAMAMMVLVMVVMVAMVATVVVPSVGLLPSLS